MSKMPRYVAFARTLDAWLNCQESGNDTWLPRHEEKLNSWCKEGPSGSGWDNGTKIDLELSRKEKLVFKGSFHHMNEHGYYDGWTDHFIVVKPSLAFGFELSITGRDRNEIKDYLSDVFYSWLREEIEE
jgi:hypothetical protein